MQADRMRIPKLALLTIAIVLFLVACHKNPAKPAAPAPAPPQPAPATPPPVPVPETWPELPLPPSRLPAPPEPPLPKDFRDGEAYFLSGKYVEAVKSYERYIRDYPVTQFKDVAMFKAGMAQALACPSPECRARSQDQFRRLVARFPQSPYSAEARFVLTLLGENDKMKSEAKARDDRLKKLTDELERLKKIDLGRKK